LLSWNCFRCCTVKICENSLYIFWTWDFIVHMPQVISKLSLVEHFLIWATENTLKIRPFSAVLFQQISANICFCRFIAFFWVLLITELLGNLLQ
jgi:hypothetical protein